MPAPQTDRAQALDDISVRLAHLRARLERATQRGQVEMHLAISDVTILLDLADAACNALRSLGK